MIKYIKFKDWEFITYDKLIIFLKEKYTLEEVEKIIELETKKLNPITQKQFKNTIKILGDISIFKSQINLSQFKGKYYFQFVNLYGLIITIKEKYKKVNFKDVNNNDVNDILAIYIFSELKKFFINKDYINILDEITNNK